MAKETLVSFILDETGSMEIIKTQTMSAFNEYIDTLKKDKKSDSILFTLTKFNSDKVQIVHDSVKVGEVAHLNNESYQPAAATPLYDAIGRTVNALENKLKGKKKQSALVIIQTDGEENASKEFDRKKIFDKIDEKKKAGWTFVFLGADQDAWLTSETLGISKGNTMSYSGVRGSNGAMGTLGVASIRYTSSGGNQTSTFYTGKDEVVVINNDADAKKITKK